MGAYRWSVGSSFVYVQRVGADTWRVVRNRGPATELSPLHTDDACPHSAADESGTLETLYTLH